MVRAARHPSYLAATRSGITFHGAGRATTSRWEDISAIEVFTIRHARGGRTRMLGVACDPNRLHGLRGWQQRMGSWGRRAYGYTQSWPAWQFDADADVMAERLAGYLADPDHRRELDTMMTDDQPTPALLA